MNTVDEKNQSKTTSLDYCVLAACAVMLAAAIFCSVFATIQFLK